MGPSLQIEKRSLEVQATDALRRRIVTGALQPGERLTEVRLSEEMSLSRGTVRSALSRLVTEGLVDLVPYSGWRVVSLTAKDAWELYTLRSSLEELAARLAAANVDAASEKPLRAAMTRLGAACKAGDLQAVADADFALHKQVIDVAGHERLAQQYTALQHLVRMYIASSDALLPTAGEVAMQHKPLIEAIVSRDVERAGRIARDHNLTEGRALVAHFRQIEEASQPAGTAAPRYGFGIGKSR
jgi:DNA-binding GntR family transcriptional regulator